MALVKTSISNGLKRLSKEEKEKWGNSLCKECKGFDSFAFVEDYPQYPMYYSCKYHNTTGYSFILEAMVYCCSFYKSQRKGSEKI